MLSRSGLETQCKELKVRVLRTRIQSVLMVSKPLGYSAWRGISEICARYDGAEMVEVAWGRFAPNSQFLDELKKEIKPIVRKQFESCDGKMKRLLAKQG